MKNTVGTHWVELNPLLEIPNTAWQWTSAHLVKQSHKTVADFWLENNLPKEIFSACRSYETLSLSPSLVQNTRKIKSSKERSTQILTPCKVLKEFLNDL